MISFSRRAPSAPQPESVSIGSQSAPTGDHGPAAHLPRYRDILSSAALAVSPLFAVSLILMRIGWAEGLIGGTIIAMVVAGMLHVMMTQVLPLMIALGTGQPAGAGKNAAVLQFAALLIVKFLVLIAVGFVVLNTRSVNLAAVLVGFVASQAGILLRVARGTAR